MRRNWAWPCERGILRGVDTYKEGKQLKWNIVRMSESEKAQNAVCLNISVTKDCTLQTLHCMPAAASCRLLKSSVATELKLMAGVHDF